MRLCASAAAATLRRGFDKAVVFVKQRPSLVMILCIAWCIRIVLVMRGGQMFWFDEHRYFRAGTAVDYVLHGQIRAGLYRWFAFEFSHAGYNIICLFPGIVHGAAAHLLGLEYRTQLLWLPALLMTPFSIIPIGLVYAIAKKTGADYPESTLAALLMACSGSMTFYVRHLLPYDASLTAILFGCWLGMDRRVSPVRSFLFGVVVSFGVFVYYSYWFVAGVVIAIHLLYGKPCFRLIFRRISPTVTGLLLWPTVYEIISRLAGLPHFVSGMLAVGKKNTAEFTTGLFGDCGDWGFGLVWQYLWQTESLILVVWTLGVGIIIYRTLKMGWRTTDYGLLWFACAGGCYLIVVAFGAGLHKFYIWGRFARALVPWMSLAAAYALCRHPTPCVFNRTQQMLAAAILIVIGGFNLAQPLNQEFFGEIKQRIASRFGRVNVAITIAGPELKDAENNQSKTRYVLVNAQHLYPIHGLKKAPTGRVVAVFSHPYQYLPYQYDNMMPNDRAILNAADISIRLIDVELAK